MTKIKPIKSEFKQSYGGLAVGDKVYFGYRDERKNKPDRYGLGTVVAGGVLEKQYDICLFWIFVISKTRKVTKVLIEFKDSSQNTEYFLREPGECLKAVDGENGNA
jgi:hypothetical protein|nr:MAG TPA: hypothetical protein [Siphoviridae sp. ctRJB2]